VCRPKYGLGTDGRVANGFVSRIDKRFHGRDVRTSLEEHPLPLEAVKQLLGEAA
jgi:hypothetical protein